MSHSYCLYSLPAFQPSHATQPSTYSNFHTPPPTDIFQYPSIIAHAWPSDHRTTCVTVSGVRLCASASALQIDGTVQDLTAGHASAVYERKESCGAECAAQWPGKEMRSACSHVNNNRKSKHYDQAVPCGFYWSGNRLLTLGKGETEACAVDVRYW